MSAKKIMSAAICLITALVSFSQEYNMYLNSKYQYQINKSLDSAVNFHTSIKPFLYSDVHRFINTGQQEKRIKNTRHKKLKEKIFNHHLIIINEGIFSVTADPLLNFEVGRDIKNNKTSWVNTRGFQVRGSIGKRFSFYSNFYENQASFPIYLQKNIIERGVIPGQGLAKKYGGDGFDYNMANGYISYSPSKYFNFQFGSGKHFIGDGYRSLLLSDNAFNYPFFKITTTVWKIKYLNLFMQLQDLPKDLPYNLQNDLEYTGDLGFDKKYAAIHYLDFKINKRLSLGIFEAIIFEARDTTNNRGFELAYLNPIIFYRPAEYSIGSPDNAYLGFNASYLVGSRNKLYGQFILDEFKFSEMTAGNGWWANKYGYQIGIKFYDFLKIKNFYLQFEYNRVRPYTYSHKTSIQSYGHYNQPLAHPLGANFTEFLTIIKYHRERFYLNYKFIYAKYGQDPEGKNYGTDIFKSYENRVQDFNNEIGQGITTNLFYNNLELSYLINPSYNLNFVVGYSSRIEDNEWGKDVTNHIYIGLRTSIDNFYFDF